MREQNILVRRIRGEKYTPYGLARKLDAAVILESTSLERGKARYSILLVEEAFRIVQEDGGEYLIQLGRAWEKRGLAGRDILDIAEEMADQHDSSNFEIPVPSGGIGYLSFEFAAYCDAMEFPERNGAPTVPLAAFIFGHVFLIFDHYTDDIYLLGLNYAEKRIDLEKAFSRVERRIFDMDFNYLSEELTSPDSEILTAPEKDRAYMDGVRQVREEIIKGNLLQGVLSRSLTVRTDLSALEAYRNLRTENPSPYMFYLDFQDFQLFGASPEVHVKSDGGTAILRPIAGTRRRGRDRAEDEALKAELLADEKEKAEHLMLVDLGRNDLGRFCEPGSVEVTEFMEIEKYSRVMHIVSQVEGRLKSGVTASKIIRDTFPAGTVSGAPKIQAVKTIGRLEEEARGYYAGLVGYLEPGGKLDTCITIRSAVMKDGLLYLRAGAGIVYDSKPERELEETNEKLRAFARAVGVEV